MKPDVTLKKKLKSFFYVLAAIILCAGSAGAQTLTITNPTSSTFTYGTAFTVGASSTGMSFSVDVTFSIGGLSYQDNSNTGTPYTASSSFNNSTGTLVPGSYTLTAQANNSAGTTATKAITIVPAAPTTTSASTCGAGQVTLSASGLPSGGTYKWYTGSTGSTLATGSTTASTYTPTLSATTTYYVSYVYGGQEGARTAVTGTVNTVPATPAFTTSVSSANVGTAVTITYTGTVPSGQTATWNFDGGVATGSGPYTVTWYNPGTHNVTLYNTNNTTGCTSAVATKSVTVSAVALSNYGFSKTIILNSSLAGISSTLTNFPALVYIKDDALKTGNPCGDKVQFPLGNGPLAAGGTAPAGTNYDFAFTKPGNSTELNYQVDTYDPINGILLAWVQIPSITSTNYPLTFYFGSATPAHSQSFSAATWASDYKVVYHFNEASTTATVLDATGNGRNAAQFNTDTTNDEIHIVTGVPIPGGGYRFNGQDAATSPNPAKLKSYILQTAGTAPDITGAFTISGWVYYNGPSTSDNKIVSNELDFGRKPGDVSGGYKMSVKSGVIETESRVANGTSVGNLGDGGTVDNTGWHYIQSVYSQTDNIFKNYVDGAPKTVTMTRSEATLNPYAGHMLSMGLDHGTGTATGGYNDANFYNGKMDEIRVSNVEKTPDWIKCEYYNQHQPLQFNDWSASVVSYQANAANLVGALVLTWTGNSGTDETQAGNWDAGYTPTFNGNVKLNIPVSSTGNYPVLTADESVYSLTIADGAQINLNGKTLSVGCNIYNNTTTGGTGILNAGNTSSGVKWVGSISQYYYGKNVKNTAEIGNMTVNNSAAGTITITGGPVDIYNTITLTKGNLAIDNGGNGDLTLKSSSTITASVAAIPSSYAITGLVNVERYISGGQVKYRGYRFLSSPVYTAKVGSDYFFDFGYLKTYAPITSTGGTADGSDKSGNPTIYLYRDDKTFTNASFNGGNFRGVNKINNTPAYNVGVDYDGNFNMRVGMGFWFFYRGNRTNIANKYTSTTVAEANTFVTRGTLNQQTVTFYSWSSGTNTLLCTGSTSYAGFNMVGNPYASSIDWNTHSTSNANAGIYTPNVGPNIYILNETTKVYGIYDGVTGTNGASNIIPSGQGFYVKATATGGQVIFHESAKTSAQVTGPTAASGNTLLLSTKPVETTIPPQYLRLEMRKDSNNVEETIVRFEDNAHNEFVNGEDAEHFSGSGNVGFASISSDNLDLAINHIPFPKVQQTVVNLDVYAGLDGQYALNRTEIKNIPDFYEIWLKDAYKKDSLDFKANSTYLFDVTRSDPNSMGQHRFSLVIRQNKALGLHLLDFAATKQTTGAQLVWKTENERNTTYFTVERSVNNGKTFEVVGSVGSSSEGIYSLTDKNPPVAADQYRLKMEDLNGTITYSKVITLMYTTGGDNLASNAVMVYPNPAVSTINLAITQNTVNIGKSVANPSYSIKITNSSGKVLNTAKISDVLWQHSVSDLLPGTYVIDVVSNDDNSVIGKAKFVKL